MGTQNTQFLTDIANLTAAVQSNTAAIQNISGLVAQDTSTIASLNAQIAALKVAQPTLDLSGLESDIAQLQANNSTVAAILPPPVGGFTIATGGTGYSVGDVATVVQAGGSGGTVTVTGVDNAGVVLGIGSLVPGTGYVTAPGVPTTGGTGTGLTVNIN